jgi:L-alanine-DL-glutamate epimerase-like enolase superfamily enzyme
VLYLRLEEDQFYGHAEAVPYARYGETPESVAAQIESIRAAMEAGAARSELQDLLAPGAARNALDCALWDLEAKKSGQSVWDMIGFAPQSVETAQTIVLDSIDEMAKSAARYSDFPFLKIKLDADLIVERVEAVRAKAPNAKIMIDANEAWSFDLLNSVVPQLVKFNVALLEQPLHANEDVVLETFKSPIPLCADESCHSSDDVDQLAKRYDAVNIKLDKTGGLTEALHLYHAARARNLTVMTGCMVGTSLGIAPILGLSTQADFVDIDGPSWLVRDRKNGLTFSAGKATPPQALSWGGATLV